MAQALPCSTSVINANPSLQTDHTRGVLVGRYPVKYDEFDNRMAAGPIPDFLQLQAGADHGPVEGQPGVRLQVPAGTGFEATRAQRADKVPNHIN